MIQFNVGDVVRLKSGGPTMTVTQVSYLDNNLVLVDALYIYKGEQMYGNFNALCLEKVPTYPKTLAGSQQSSGVVPGYESGQAPGWQSRF